MIFADARCEDCNHIFQIEKTNTMDDFVISDCPKCGSNKVHRKFGLGTFDIAIGKMGRAKNGYENSFVNHCSELGRYKGVKYSSTNKNNK